MSQISSATFFFFFFGTARPFDLEGWRDSNTRRWDLKNGVSFSQVCELVKFMIEHCQQILGDDPTSLFGGPPLKPPPEEMGSG